MAATPDLQGFRGAMDRLRQNFGQDIPFHVPVAKSWPPGTQLDPETGEPYDPAVEPVTGGGFTDVVKHVGVITKTLTAQRESSDTRFEPGGEFSGMTAVLDLEDIDHIDVMDATEATVYGERYKIVEFKPNGLGGDTEADRWLVYLEAK